MARPKNIERRIAINHSFDYEYYNKFEQLVGKGNVSDELRAFIKDRVDQAKKEEGLLTTQPLNLHGQNEDKSNRQTKLFEDFHIKDVRNDIVKFLDAKDNVQGLEVLYRNCNTVVKVIETKKARNRFLGQMQRKGN